MKPKPGYKTSEFWFTLVSFIFSGLYLIGIIGENSHKEDLIRDVSHGVESCILIGGQLVILYKYINGRSTIKQQSGFPEEPKIDDNGTDTIKKPRANKSRVRKTNTKLKNKVSRNKKSNG